MPSESESDASVSESESTKSKTPKGDDSDTKIIKKPLVKSVSTFFLLRVGECLLF